MNRSPLAINFTETLQVVLNHLFLLVSFAYNMVSSSQRLISQHYDESPMRKYQKMSDSRGIHSVDEISGIQLVDEISGIQLVDEISELPDPILGYILSFLPTKMAVATSILSSRWRFVWTNVPCLSFVNDNEDDVSSFTHFVYKVLQLQEAQSIEKFSLSCKYCNAKDIEKWVSNAVARNVKDLDLNVADVQPSPIQMPFDLFSSKSLVALKLNGDILLDFPSSVCLPNLKTLHLVAVKYQDEESFSKLISSCLVLENLLLERSKFDFKNVFAFNISSPTLKWLSLFKKFPLGAVRSKVDLNVSALQYLLSTSVFRSLRAFKTEKLPFLVEADLGLYISDTDAAMTFLQELHNVKVLSLHGNLEMEIISAPAELQFPNLVRLKLNGWCCEWNLLQLLIERSDNLEYIKFIKGTHFTRQSDHMNCWKDPECTPKCLISSLSHVSIEGFEGLEDELMMLKYILKNGRVLKRVKIRTDSRHLDTNAKLTILQKISTFQRSSPTCEIVFFLGSSKLHLRFPSET